MILGITSSSIYKASAVAATFDLTAATYNTNFLDHTGLFTTFPQDIELSPDGSVLLITENAATKIHQYILSTPWDLSTAVYDTFLTVTGYDRSCIFADSGNMLIVHNSSTSNNVKTWTLSTPYDIGSAGASVVDTPWTDLTYGLFLNADGTKGFYGSNGSTGSYTLSTPYDMSTATQTAYGTQAVSMGICANTLGDRIYTGSVNADSIRQYDLGTAYDSSTAGAPYLFDPTSLITGANTGTWYASYVTPNGQHMYITSNSSPWRIYRLDQ